MTPPESSLPAGTVVDNYVLKKLVATGGFSMIYLAEDLDSNDEVVLKEFLPKKLARRVDTTLVTLNSPDNKDQFNRGKRMFFQEAKVLARLKHPNIVNVYNFFLANDTAYMVMDYHPGENLGRFIKARKGNLNPSFVLRVFKPLLSALQLIHSHQLLHLDIKPSNIHLRAKNLPILLDFGAVHTFSNSSLPAKGHVITPGFSPVEQYYASGNVGPWTDIYAVAASMRACIEGKAPPAATKRHAKDTLKPAGSVFKRRYPKHLLEAIDWAMEIEPAQRPQDTSAFMEALQIKRQRPEPSSHHPDLGYVSSLDGN